MINSIKNNLFIKDNFIKSNLLFLISKPINKKGEIITTLKFINLIK